MTMIYDLLQLGIKLSGMIVITKIFLSEAIFHCDFLLLPCVFLPRVYF